MEKVRPWCGQPSDRGRLRNRTEQNRTELLANIWRTSDQIFPIDSSCARLASSYWEPEVEIWRGNMASDIVQENAVGQRFDNLN